MPGEVRAELVSVIRLDTLDSDRYITDRDTGRSRGFAFVQRATSDAADEAIRKFNGYELGGRTLKVEISKPSASRGGGN